MPTKYIRNFILKKSNGNELQSKIYNGSFWITAGFGLQKIIQLLGNLLLTRLLFPEAFGLMAIVNVFLTGLILMSDIGITPSIIQAKNVDRPNFLNTAWTLQIIRGTLLWIIVCALAYPAAKFYGDPQLFGLLCLTGIGAFFRGFVSINTILAERNIELKKVVYTQIIGQIVTFVIMVTLALIYKSVWALAIGTIFGSAFSIFLGHFLFSGHKHALCFKVKYARQIFHFGKWIFWGTLFTFFGGQGIRIIEGAFVSTSMLGIISIAATLAWITGELISRLLGAIVFPSLSKINRDNPENLPKALTKVRTIATLASLPVFGLISIFSTFIINILYDERYSFAGPVLSILAINAFIKTLPMFYQNGLLAQGNSKFHFFISAALAFFSITGLITGYYAGGIYGMLIGSGVGSLIGHLVAVLTVYKNGWVSIKVEIATIILISLLAALSFSINFHNTITT